MPPSQLLMAMKIATAAIALSAAIVLLIVRMRQKSAVGATIESRREDKRAFAQRRCPHYSDKELYAARRVYVRPDCAQVDPANEVEFRKFASVREPIFQSVRRFFDSEQKRHLLLLADSGMGKTTFCLNFFVSLRNEQKQMDVALVSLARANSVVAIQNIPSPRTTALILDALDEDPKALVSGADRLTEIMDFCSEFPLVIVTCRSHFFENDAAIPVRTGISRIGPRSAGRTSSYEFARLYLLPFDENQITLFLKKSFPIHQIYSLSGRRKAKELINAIPDLSARPMLLSLVPELIKNNIEPKEIYELYEYMIDQWLIREEKWVDPKKLLDVSIRIAMHLSISKQTSGVDRVPPEDVRLLNLTNEAFDWRHLTTRSLLNRDSEGQLKFAHRSIMEFLAVRGSLEGDHFSRSIVWSDFMRELLLSYGALERSDLDGSTMLAHLISSRENTHFPYADPVSAPMIRTRTEIEAIANPSRRSYLSRHSIPPSWIPATVSIRKSTDHILINDENNGLYWRALNTNEGHVSNNLDIYKVSMAEAFRADQTDGFDLPSFPEFLRA